MPGRTPEKASVSAVSSFNTDLRFSPPFYAVHPKPYLTPSAHIHLISEIFVLLAQVCVHPKPHCRNNFPARCSHVVSQSGRCPGSWRQRRPLVPPQALPGLLLRLRHLRRRCAHTTAQARPGSCSRRAYVLQEEDRLQTNKQLSK